jgi:hypothetical protein
MTLRNFFNKELERMYGDGSGKIKLKSGDLYFRVTRNHRATQIGPLEWQYEDLGWNVFSFDGYPDLKPHFRRAESYITESLNERFHMNLNLHIEDL